MKSEETVHRLTSFFCSCLYRPAALGRIGPVQQQPALFSIWRFGGPVLPEKTVSGGQPLDLWLQHSLLDLLAEAPPRCVPHRSGVQWTRRVSWLASGKLCQDLQRRLSYRQTAGPGAWQWPDWHHTSGAHSWDRWRWIWPQTLQRA